MENVQAMTQSITQTTIKAMKAAAQVVSETAGAFDRNNTTAATPNMSTRNRRLALKLLNLE